MYLKAVERAKEPKDEVRCEVNRKEVNLNAQRKEGKEGKGGGSPVKYALEDGN